ncbi:MAG: DeoR/GlpR family DNA-binding transcription regulator [Parvibaculaceae bacterium]|nr:DeoR/GlpR family DNA-binding transcription regulator [Parvibaculaceae bacterium]
MSEPSGGRLSKGARQERILSEVNASPTLRVSELAGHLKVSTETIRRDLDELEVRGLISRTYGGAVRPFGPEPGIMERHQMMVAEREAIAVVAAGLVRHNDVVVMGGGATTVHVARRLAAEKRELTVITHSFGVATVFAPNPTIKVLVCPGHYNGREGQMFGAETIDYLRKFYANWAIVGATGLTGDGPNDADADSGAVYRAMLSRAANTMVVADHGKFDRPALSVYGHWTEVNRLITDVAPSGTLLHALERAGVEVMVPNRP